MASDVSKTSVRFLTGGDFAIGDHVGAIRGQAQKSLFIMLALSAGRTVSRDRIVAALWPDADPKTGRANLRTALLALKRALETLGGPKIKANNEAITLLDVTVDLDTFELLAESDGPEDWRRALQLYKGDFWPDAQAQSEDFNSLLDIEREKWRSAAVLVAERLVGSIDENEHPDDAIEAANALLKIDPAHEPTHRLLMRVFNRKGDRGMALRQFEHFRSALLNAYDLQPSAETCALRDEIARSDANDAKPGIQTREAETADMSRDPRQTTAQHSAFALSRRSIMLSAGAALAALGVGAFGFYQPSGDLREPRLILAIEPFRHDAADSGLADFVQSLRTALLIDLASEGGALVTIAETQDWRSSDVASEFHLRGSVQRSGASVKASLQLVSARDQMVVWAGAEMVGLDAIESLSHSIARDSLGALRASRSQ